SLPVVYDYVEVDSDLYTIMSYIEGESLADKEDMAFGVNGNPLLSSSPAFSLADIRKWGIEIAGALSTLHSQNPPIYHLDVKPANIMIQPDNRAVLIDFNISWDGKNASRFGYTKGFGAPEQEMVSNIIHRTNTVPDLSVITPAADIYALGAVLYSLATGVIYDPSSPRWDVISQNYVPELTEILKKALAPNRLDRYGSAEEMKMALATMEKANQRLIQWEKKAKIQRLIAYVGLGVCIGLFGFSFFLMRSEKQHKYDSLVDAMIQDRLDQNYEEVEELFNEARSLNPERLGAYLEKAQSLYDQRKYSECVEFISQSILNDQALDNQPGIETAYYFLADSLANQGKYDEALEAYEILFEFENLQPTFYRDYAIALAKKDQFQAAEQILNEAQDKGIDNSSLRYAKAEIAYAQGNESQALTLMEQVAEETTDESLKMHAMLKSAEWNMASKNYVSARKILQEAKDELSAGYQPLILQNWIETNSKLADSTNNPNYRDEAINSLEEMISNNWATYIDYNNLVVYYQKQGELEKAEVALAKMEDRFGSDYVTAKRHAWLEIDKQEKKTEKQRSYANFEKWYQQAKDQYMEGQNDPEMSVLEGMYQDIKRGGWL
ncbi:MAG: tetratricopeptide repeat protein, partial [Allobaculum sp.]|nr:tetratricopeptide repeat protein [Allobaculum sp.]